MKIDISGKRYGKLTVIKQKNNQISKKNSIWLCKCDCGNEKSISKPNLNRGQMSCGCLIPKIKAAPLKFDLQGKTKNFLTAIQPLGGKQSNWLVKCICGKEIVIQKADFVLGKRKSCGCIKPIHKLSNLKDFLSNVIIKNDCWEWTKPLIKKTGYGQFTVNRRLMLSHRASWILHYGEIPKGKLICHHCDNRKCVNPNHLYIGTHKTNALDRVARNFESFKKVKKCV